MGRGGGLGGDSSLQGAKGCLFNLVWEGRLTMEEEIGLKMKKERYEEEIITLRLYPAPGTNTKTCQLLIIWSMPSSGHPLAQPSQQTMSLLLSPHLRDKETEV